MGGCETTPGSRTDPPGSQHPSEPRPRQATTGGLSSLAIIGRRLPASSSFVLARALTGANGCGRSSLTPDRRGGTGTSSYEETQHNSQPGDYQVTGSAQHALLTAKASMGGCSEQCRRPASATCAQRVVGARRDIALIFPLTVRNRPLNSVLRGRGCTGTEPGRSAA